MGYLVSITMDDAQSVLPGMTAAAEITTVTKENVLLVPVRAITRQGQNRVVKVLTPGGTETRAVRVGTSNDQSAEIVSGVQEGDEVILPTTTARAAVPGAGAGIGGGPPPGGF